MLFPLLIVTFVAGFTLVCSLVAWLHFGCVGFDCYAVCRMKRKQQDPQCQPPTTKRRVAGRQPSSATATLRAIPGHLLGHLFPLLVDCLEEELSEESLARVVARFESKRRGRRLCLPDDLVCCVFSFFARTPREWRALRLCACCAALCLCLVAVFLCGL